MKTVKIKAIFFDLGNVLIKINSNRLIKGWQAHGNINPKRVIEYFLDSDNMNRYMEGKLSSSVFYTKTKRLFKLDIKYREFYDIWNSIFLSYPEMDDIIKTLKRDYPEIKLILVSNTNEAHYDFIRQEFKILDFFDHLVVSHEIGVQKPRPEIFLEAMKYSQALPKETFYTDDRDDLIEKARVMGIRAYQFAGHEELSRQLEKFNINVN